MLQRTAPAIRYKAIPDPESAQNGRRSRGANDRSGHSRAFLFGKGPVFSAGADFVAGIGAYGAAVKATLVLACTAVLDPQADE